MSRIVEIRIKDGDTMQMVDSFKLGDGYSKSFGGAGIALGTREYAHDDNWVIIGYEFKPVIINLKPAPHQQKEGSDDTN